MPVNCQLQRPRTQVYPTYHWLDIRMRYSIEFVEIELELWADIDVGAFILGAVAIPRC